MTYTYNYSSPLGEILLAANDNSLTGLWFCGAKYFAAGLEDEREEKKRCVGSMSISRVQSPASCRL